MSDPVRRKQRIPAQTENERRENEENQVAGEVPEGCQNDRNPLNTRGKRKPVYPEDYSGETGCHQKNGGAGVNRKNGYKPII